MHAFLGNPVAAFWPGDGCGALLAALVRVQYLYSRQLEPVSRACMILGPHSWVLKEGRAEGIIVDVLTWDLHALNSNLGFATDSGDSSGVAQSIFSEE